MHASVHGAIGVLVNQTVFSITKDIGVSYVVGNSINVPLHIVLDLIGENNYGGKKAMIMAEVFCFILSMYCIYNDHNSLLLFSGWFFSNLPDIIDKKMYFSILFPDRFKYTYYFHWRNQAKINLTNTQTYLLAVIFSLLIFTL